jgi:putative transposase
MTPEIEAIFEKGVRRFYEKRDAPPLEACFERILGACFAIGVEVVDGVELPVLPPAVRRPTWWQFRHWFRKRRDLERELRARFGDTRFELEHRELLGESTSMATGPGSVFQIDATIGDVYLVSSVDRALVIGRPVIYFVVDVFSRLIAGFSVSLEGPIWLGAMLALDNTLRITG